MKAAPVEAAPVKVALVKAALVKAAPVKAAEAGGESMRRAAHRSGSIPRVQKADTVAKKSAVCHTQILAIEGWSTFPTSRLYCSFQRSSVPPLSGRFLACEGQRGGAKRFP